ncbi:TylF/MycF/NovP-related O-methyltransferase [Parvibaculum sp.]|uniref:TylF/MycF/NovP-related O-methyltransferase n=1 Tax=Parvibaculum sp. TaxID=2024848 RepID=UPI002736C26A|nr:TylF/MycF/NovP-related O-methyltransferase [Parvibaculum sp.]MDP3327218.1 TylF/MycF/NovP-related O-methyltransferase [Parvibaculum sp.]
MSDRAAYSNQNDAEDAAQGLLEAIARSDLLPAGELLRNIGLFLRQKDLAHILFMADLYRRIVDVPGYIAEFGVMWGRNLSLLMAMRECFEPYNHTRKIVGFDTFAGFVGTTTEDHGDKPKEGMHGAGDYGVAAGYEKTLADILSAHQNTAHLAHVKKFEIVKGDVTETLPRWMKNNPHAVFAFCYLDLDLYEPTKAVLQQVKGRLVKGSVLAFDEVLNPSYPGETVALDEMFGIPNMRLLRTPLSGWKTFWVVE